MATIPPTSNGSPQGPIRPAMRVYRAEQRRRRRWPKVLALTVVFLLASVAVSAAGLKYWVDQKVVKIGTAKNEAQAEAQASLDVENLELPNRPIVAMLIGEDRRKGDTSARSDTMMLVRLDPQKRAITTLSFPRDLLVDVPGHGRMMINEAFALGKEPLALETVKQLTGIRVNYLVPIDFKGFYELVDAFDGVWLEVDRRYSHTNVSGDGVEDFAEINLAPGYRKLSGHQALDFARYRHTDTDELRLARQQQFLREFRKRVDAWSAAKNVLDLIGVAERNIRILGPKNKRPSTDTLLDYANLLRAIPRENIQTITLRTTPDSVDRNRVDTTPEWVQEAVSAFSNPDPTAASRVVEQQLGKDPKDTAKPAKTGPAFDRATFPVEVRNGSGQGGVAGDVAYLLVQRGWKNVVQTADAETSDYLSSTVYYADVKGAQDAAKAIAKMLGADAEVEPLDAAKREALLSGSGEAVAGDVVAVVGRTFDGELAQDATQEQALPEKEKPKLDRNPRRDLDGWRDARKRAGISLEMPTVLPAGAVLGDPVETTFDKFYVYTEEKKRAVHVTYSFGNAIKGSAETFGIQAIRWASPPILDSPSATRTIDGREFLIFTNGTRIHRVAWKLKGGVWMWISNSLGDALTNEQMLATARGFKPIPR